MKRYLLPMAFLAFAAQATTDTDAVIVARREFQGLEFSIGTEPVTACLSTSKVTRPCSLGALQITRPNVWRSSLW